MANVKTIEIADGVSSVDKLEAEGFQEIEIRIPASVEKISAFTLECNRDATVRVYYAGTVSDWKKIKKGTLEETTVKHDWYGYYYHNEPYETTTKKKYFNWVGSENVTIICSDGTIKDDKEENKSNPAHISSHSYWD